MRIPLRRFFYLVGCLLVSIVSCQTKVLPLSTEVKPEIKSLSFLFSELKARKSAIRDVKAFVRTKISGKNFNQSFRQTLLVKGNEAMRVDTYSLFRQVLGVLIYEGEKTLMYDPIKSRVISGEEVGESMRQILGLYIDFGDYISVFSGGIPHLSNLKTKVAKWNSDQTVLQIETINQKTGERVDLGIDAYTLLPISLTMTQGTQEIYRVYWADYRKVDKFKFAHKVVVEIKSKKQSITVRYSDVMINQGIPFDTFELASGLMN
jgi:outer membrane lipoprotein-sorting protein